MLGGTFFIFLLLLSHPCSFPFHTARLRQYDDLVDERNLIESAKTSGKLILPPGPRLGKVVFECINITKARRGRRPRWQSVNQPPHIATLIFHHHNSNYFCESSIFNIFTKSIYFTNK